MKKSTWQGKLFLGGLVPLAAAIGLYIKSEATSNAHLGHVTEIWAWVAAGIFAVCWAIALLGAR